VLITLPGSGELAALTGVKSTFDLSESTKE
jgi:hypothetical protein